MLLQWHYLMLLGCLNLLRFIEQSLFQSAGRKGYEISRSAIIKTYYSCTSIEDKHAYCFSDFFFFSGAKITIFSFLCKTIHYFESNKENTVAWNWYFPYIQTSLKARIFVKEESRYIGLKNIFSFTLWWRPTPIGFSFNHYFISYSTSSLFWRWWLRFSSPFKVYPRL